MKEEESLQEWFEGFCEKLKKDAEKSSKKAQISTVINYIVTGAFLLYNFILLVVALWALLR